MPVKYPEFLVTTERLFLQGFRSSDWRDLQRFAGVPCVAGMTCTVKSPWGRSDVEDWIATSRFDGRPGFRLAVRLKNGPLIGSVALGRNPVDLGYFIDPAHWGKGYASEALAGFIPACFSRFAIDEIRAEVFQDNPASVHVLEKLGFKQSGVGSCTSHARLEPQPNYLYRLTKPAQKAANR